MNLDLTSYILVGCINIKPYSGFTSLSNNKELIDYAIGYVWNLAVISSSWNVPSHLGACLEFKPIMGLNAPLSEVKVCLWQLNIVCFDHSEETL